MFEQVQMLFMLTAWSMHGLAEEGTCQHHVSKISRAIVGTWLSPCLLLEYMIMNCQCVSI